MQVTQAILTRQSPNRLVDPAPPDEVIDAALRAATAAPDHGMLRPWRFFIIRGDDRHRLGALFAERLRSRSPDVSEADLERERSRPLRAPLIIAVASRLRQDHPKVPTVEQVLATGAAIQNMLLAFHASGYATMWKTGPAAYDDLVKKAFGLDSADVLAGFIYVGMAPEQSRPKPRPDPAEFTQRWPRTGQERPDGGGSTACE
jgi:nitroreductase